MSHPTDTDTFVMRSASAVAASHVTRRHNAGAAAAAKMEAADFVRVKMFTPESVRAIQEYRRDNSLTQKQLDQRCSFPVNTMNLLESRRAGPTSGQLQALNRLMKTGLSLD
jgi:DNA-binding transcriptional regulator YiaG